MRPTGRNGAIVELTGMPKAAEPRPGDSPARLHWRRLPVGWVLRLALPDRIEAVRALLAKPDLLLLDEPFSALDRPLRRQVAAGLREFIRKRGILLVLVSHDEGDAVALAQ